MEVQIVDRSNIGKGDIIGKKFGETKEWYIVTDVNDYSVRNTNGTYIEDINYEVMMVFPIRKKIKISSLNDRDVILYRKSGTARYNEFLYHINKKRELRGFKGEADYMMFVDYSPSMVFYDRLKTIDECLDAMNDLKWMGELLGGEDYEINRGIVIDRLRELMQGV